ncbi:restriction endonuclease subunit S [Virgibacillus sp. MSP4-1]|uniref:restriction endonuclease subunit S n=1 Tax=Virgibacillus sp. MSP4-1 TaxID=2700081 RepID=UPI0003A5F38C|nr:restriction endonuclease subunit S [Virgibacillus sp. MSP4-1]QHS24329.1 restriction endonuclease subunit S [Virgibacillus sp. MSP4-1]
MELGDIARIKTGLVLSRKKAKDEYDIKAKYRLLSLKNVSDEGIINTDSVEEFNSNDELDDHYFTKEGDVLMRLSHPHTSVFIGNDHSGLLIPSYFAIIKVDIDKFLPEYIAWYLNTFEVKKELERSQSGSRIPSTNKNVLRSLPVVKTTISRQKAFIELLRLHQQEKLLYKRLIEEKEVWFKEISKQILKDKN